MRRWWTVRSINGLPLLSPTLALFPLEEWKREERGEEGIGGSVNFRRDTRGKLIGLFDARLSVSLGPCVCQCHALQFHRQSDAYKNTLKYMNMCFTGMFTVECILKIAAFGVRVSSTIKHQQAPSPSPSNSSPFIERIIRKKIVFSSSSSSWVFISSSLWILSLVVVEEWYVRRSSSCLYVDDF